MAFGYSGTKIRIILELAQIFCKNLQDVFLSGRRFLMKAVIGTVPRLCLSIPRCLSQRLESRRFRIPGASGDRIPRSVCGSRASGRGTKGLLSPSRCPGEASLRRPRAAVMALAYTLLHSGFLTVSPFMLWRLAS